MTHASLTIIAHEHRALSAMLRAILLLLGDHRRRGTLPDFGALRAMLFYVDEFPEKLHHPKESLLLFPKLRGHSAPTDAVLDPSTATMRAASIWCAALNTRCSASR